MNSGNLKKNTSPETAMKRIFHRLDKLVQDPGFTSSFHDTAKGEVNKSSDRQFGLVYLDSLSFYYTTIGYHEKISGNHNYTLQNSKGFAHSQLAFEIEASDLFFMAANRREYYPIGGEVCLMGFARAVSYGYLEIADWWATQLQRIYSLNPEYLLSSLPDQYLATHLLLIARCWNQNRWATQDEINSNLCIYEELWRSDQDEKGYLESLNECASYHLNEALNNDVSPFGMMPNGPYPLELLAWIGLYKKIRSINLAIPNHPLFQNQLVQHPIPMPQYADDWLEEIRARAQFFYGASWIGFEKPTSPRFQ
ncbi:MAG TPA: hypothetical protein PLW86_16020 [Rhodocyclaceae bacterium]|nr:hypothetical protein [Rhodocyclaceae bacterium]